MQPDRYTKIQSLSYKMNQIRKGMMILTFHVWRLETQGPIKASETPDGT